MNKEIKIQKAWLKKLIEIAELVEANQIDKNDWTTHLIGYIDSAKAILESKEEE